MRVAGRRRCGGTNWAYASDQSCCSRRWFSKCRLQRSGGSAVEPRRDIVNTSLQASQDQQKRPAHPVGRYRPLLLSRKILQTVPGTDRFERYARRFCQIVQAVAGHSCRCRSCMSFLSLQVVRRMPEIDCHVGIRITAGCVPRTRPSADGFLENRQSQPALARGVLSRWVAHGLAILVHQGRTPPCRIRRWCGERAPGYFKGLPLGCVKAFWPRATEPARCGPIPLTVLMVRRRPQDVLAQSAEFRRAAGGRACRPSGRHVDGQAADGLRRHDP